MSRVTMIMALTAVSIMCSPNAAYAEGRFTAVSFEVHMALSSIGLLVAVFLLVEALAVRKLARGGAVAQRISFVVLATVCLAASALAEWGTNFVVDLTLEQVQLASEVLVIVAMALLSAYFWTVREGMSEFLRKASDIAKDAESDSEAGDTDSEAANKEDERA